MGYLSVYDAFQWSYFTPTLVHFAHWLAVLLPTVTLVLPLVLCRRPQGRLRLLAALALWFAIPVLVYACYEVSQQAWWCLRFILPALPALILAALMGLQVLLARRPRALVAAASGLGLWSIAVSWYWTAHFHTLLVPTYERAYAEVGSWARDHLPANSVVACLHDSGAIYYYTPLTVLRWDQIESADFTGYATAITRAGRPLYAITFPFEEKEALTGHAPGQWEKLVRVANRDVWRYHGPSVSNGKP